MGDVLSIGNVYQLVGFLSVLALQFYTKRSVSALSRGQGVLKNEIEATRAVMFRVARIPSDPDGSSEGRVAAFATTVEAALRVAYLQGKADAGGDDVMYPHERIASAARRLAEYAGGGELTMTTGFGGPPGPPSAPPMPGDVHTP